MNDPARAMPAAQAPELTVRQLLVDLQEPIEPCWHRNEFLTQFFNALSMSFPVGEQFFIDSVRGALPLLPAGPEHEGLREELRRFIGQEASHRHIHGQYNAQLQAQGLTNHWQHWASKRIAFAHRRGLTPLDLLAVTCAYEHLTATLAEITLRHSDCLDGAQPRMQTLWRWHAAEEIEHRSVAFALFQAAGGRYGQRVRWFLQVLVTLVIESNAQTLVNLHRRAALRRPSTWWQAADFFLGRRGLAWRCAPALLRYLRRNFHPRQRQHVHPDGSELAAQWLTEHASQWRAIR